VLLHTHKDTVVGQTSQTHLRLRSDPRPHLRLSLHTWTQTL